MEEIHKARQWGRAQSFHVNSISPVSLKLLRLPTWKLSDSHPFWVFWRLRYIDMIKSLAVGDWTSFRPLFLLCCSFAKSFLTLCNPMDCSMLGFPVLHYLFAQTHIHWVGFAIHHLYLLSPPSSPALNISQHQGLFQRVGSFNQWPKYWSFRLQFKSFQWIFRVDFL